MDTPDSPEKIFRQDFIDGKKQRWLGHAILISEVPSYWFVLGTAFVIAILLGFVVFAEFTRRINVNGEVISSPHPSTILAPQNGTIIQSHLTAGQFVQKDQPLLQLDVSRSSNQGNSSREALLAVKKQLLDVEQLMAKLKQDHRATQDNLNSQLEKTKQIYQRSNQRYVTAQTGLSQMHKMAEDYAAYLKKGWVTREQVNQLRYLYYERQNAVENIYNQLSEQAISIKAIEKEINNRRSELNTQLTQHQVQYNDLIRQQAELNANHIVVVKAPQAGYIENIIADQGKMVSAGDSLLQLSPSILPAPDLTPAFDGWYNIPENEYIQVAVQVYVAGKKKQYYDVPTYNVSNGCGSTHCVDKVGTGGQAKIRLRVKRKFVGRTSIISRLVTSVYMNTLANEPVGAPVSLIYLSADFNVPQSCTFDVGDIIEFDFGSISASAFANAGAGLPAKGVKVITKNIGLQCKGIDAQQMLTARLEVANPKGNMIVSNNPDVGFQLADKDSKVLIPNNFYSNIPFQLDQNIRGNFILKSWPVSITGKRPAAGPVTGQGYVRIDFQ